MERTQQGQAAKQDQVVSADEPVHGRGRGDSAAGRVAELHAVGLRLPRGRLLTKKGRREVLREARPRLGTEQLRLVDTHFALIDDLQPVIRELDPRIEQLGHDISAVQILRTVPGIGPYRALLIATEVMPIHRFPSPAHLVRYAGLAPRSSPPYRNATAATAC